MGLCVVFLLDLGIWTPAILGILLSGSIFVAAFTNILWSHLIDDEFYLLIAVWHKEGELSNRAWVAFPTAEEAIKDLHKYPDFYLESGYYNYLLIEKHVMGSIMPDEKSNIWYSASFDPKTGTYSLAKCECPKQLEHTVNWGLG